MLLTEEEYNKPINFRNKQTENSTLALKFHEAVRITMKKLFEEDKYYIHSILDSKTKVKKKNSEYGSSNYQLRNFKLEYIKRFPTAYWYSTISKKETQYFNLDLSKEISYYLKDDRRMHSWDEQYFKDFIKFTSLQSKNFKKKLTKVVYIFENETSDKKYRKIFNFLVNYFNIHTDEYVRNYDNKTGELIDDTKISGYRDKYYLTDFERILEPIENRNRAINKILNNKKVDA